MNATFLGGGSLRLLPIIRGIFAQTPEIFRNGSIRLVDLQLERAEAVAALIKRCPEYSAVNCEVIATANVDEVLPGTDVMYLTMAARREPSWTQAAILANEYGYLSSDNVSINGAFLSLRLGSLILSIARKMEKHCPDALMLIFPNPISVYSAMVNKYTKIRALGICGGFGNHRWDLPRICGRDRYEGEWNVVAAGINHLSFIIRGEYKGEDVFSILDRTLTPDWKCMEITTNPNAWLSVETLVKIYRRFGRVIFSTEGDGMFHIDYEAELARVKQRLGEKKFDAEAAGRKGKEEIAARFADFIAVSRSAEVNWNAPGFASNTTDITLPILRALAGIEKMRIVASRPNGGAVAGFPAGTALEYTMDIDGKNVTPVPDQYVDAPFHGLVASLAEFQTLQADALGQQSPRLFADALEAYPMNRFRDFRIPFIRKMFDIFSDVSPEWRKALDYLN